MVMWPVHCSIVIVDRAVETFNKEDEHTMMSSALSMLMSQAWLRPACQ